MPTIDLDGATLHFHDQGRGTPVLLLHPYPLTGEFFRKQWEALGERWRIVVPDHRGFGASSPVEGVLSMEQLAQDALALLDRLGLESAFVGGVSMGGYAAMALLREDPSRVRGLLLMDTHPLADDAAGKEKREANAAALLARGIDAAVDGIPGLVAKGASPEVRGEVERLVRQNRPASLAAAQRGMAQRTDSREILARFQGPALVLGGEEDTFSPPERIAQMADLIAGAQKVIIPGAGHLAAIEKPDEVNAEIVRFMVSVGG
jgi:pimeloyl-ACP methyl ester carboxylesterase